MASLREPCAQARRTQALAACGDDGELRERVLALLAAHEGAPPEQTVGDAPGAAIGPYRLLEEIGVGGFGVVYRAEQTEPVRRQVALKVLRPGMGTHEVVSRFEAERQALALMDHPNIARVLDGGTTPDGRPYFVMELVHGVHIHDYCDRLRLGVLQRLRLFIRVCRAVQHAHQKGVIHRDIKPSNVLVATHDGEPAPKVIDFGVAKAIGGQLGEASFQTCFAQMIGTPQYMSPEQAELGALEVDTRSDVYSLGVLLYELLTGTPPITRERLADASFDELRRIIREEDSPTPSTRLVALNGLGSEVARARRTDPGHLVKLVHGDLDWIVMRALEKDPSRRYESAGALAGDVERFLAGRPVEARPPSAFYRARKFAGRNRVGVASAAVLLLSIALAGGAAGWIARDRANRQAIREQEIGRALEPVRSALEADRLPEAREAIRRAEGLLAGGAASGELGDTVGRLHHDLEMLTRLEHARLARAARGDAPRASAGADVAYESAFRWYGLDVLALDPDAAERGIERSEIRRGLVAGLDDWLTCCATDAHRERLRALLDRADRDPWRRRFREAVSSGDKEVLQALARRYAQVGRALCAQGRFDEAISMCRKAIELDAEAMGAYQDLGRALQNQDRLYEAEVVFREAIDLDPNDVWPRFLLAQALRAHGKFSAAIGAYKTVLDIHPRNAGVFAHLVPAYLALGQVEQAVAAGRTAVELEDTRPLAHARLACALVDAGSFEEAVSASQQALELDAGYEVAYVIQARALSALGRSRDAIDACLRAIDLGATESPDYPNPLHDTCIARDRLEESAVHRRLAWVFATVPDAGLREPARAVELAQRAVQLGPKVARNWTALGVARYRADQYDRARDDLRRSVGLPGGGTARDRIFLAMTEWQAGRKDAARMWYERAVSAMGELQDPDEELARFRAEAEELLEMGARGKR